MISWLESSNRKLHQVKHFVFEPSILGSEAWLKNEKVLGTLFCPIKVGLLD